jgi:hypothetical protein
VFIIPTAVLFYTTLALLAAQDSDPRPPRFMPATVPLSAALLYLAARLTIADHALELSQRAIQAHDAAAAAVYYGRYDRWRLPGTSAALWYSRSLANLLNDSRLRLQVFPMALVAGQAATRQSEEPFNAWYSLASLYAVENDAAGTERSLRQAIAANPKWFKPYWTLAQLLLLENRIDEACSEAAIAVRLDGGKHPEVRKFALQR